ncbi:MAG: MotA/TolQ/ExbB proton channel family protein [Victivallaceae bacterium]|nr:MotA/TolQ/ExbB proton channel family protein [Victivallaceae bacterium]
MLSVGMFFPMRIVAASPGVYYAFENSDMLGKGIVVLLLIGSVFTWTVMIDKALALYRAKVCSDRFLNRFRSVQNNIASPGLVRDAAQDPGPVARVYCGGVERLLEFYENDALNRQYSATAPGNRPVKLSDAQYNAVEAVLEREVSGQIQELETRIGLLATLVSVSPFCGLFGTVWGVMLAFCGIAAAGKSDFAALAPGVAGALLTTVAGLIVAIPSLVGYNLLTSTIRNLTISMDNFTEEFMVRVKLEQLAIDQAAKSAADGEPLK